jgi:hypothetical protein
MLGANLAIGTSTVEQDRLIARQEEAPAERGALAGASRSLGGDHVLGRERPSTIRQ